MSDEPVTLEDALELLPPATPLFVPDELLAVWFPPWFGEGSFDPDSLRSAETSQAALDAHSATTLSCRIVASLSRQLQIRSNEDWKAAQ